MLTDFGLVDDADGNVFTASSSDGSLERTTLAICKDYGVDILFTRGVAMSTTIAAVDGDHGTWLLSAYTFVAKSQDPIKSLSILDDKSLVWAHRIAFRCPLLRL